MSSVDSQPPVITLPQSWPLGRSADYTVADPSAGSGQAGSGLSSVRVVITDQQERYPKVHWDEAVSGATFQSVIEWDGLWADKSKAQPGEYLAWVKAADNAGNESFAVGKIRVEGKNPLSGTGAPVITLPSLPTAAALPPVPTAPLSTSDLQPSTSNPPTFGGQTGTSPAAQPQTTRFHPPTKPSPIQNRQSQVANLWWGGAAAGAAGAFLAESLRRKKEREKRLQDYHNRPKDGGEGEGKGNHLTGKQIAKAYQAAMSNFKATLQKAQSLGMSAAQAAQLKANVTASGKIGASLGAADGYIKQKEQERADWIEQQEAADAAFIQEMQAAQAATPPKPAFDPAKWKQSDYAESARWERQQAYLRYRQGERGEYVTPVVTPEPKKPWWQRIEDKISDGLVALGQKSPFAKRVLLTAATGWFRYGQPIVNAAADFLGGFATQTVQNNLDALATMSPMPPHVRQNYNHSWESIHSGRSVWYQAGRFTASLVGIAQGVWEMGSGVATASGGTVISCGTMILCFAGGGAAVVAGGAVAVHGALVTSVSIINTVRSGQALFAAAKGGSGLRVGDVLPDHPDAKLVRSRTPQGPAREYEAHVLNKPDPNVEIEVNGVKFDWYEGDTLLDAKNAAETRSWYDVSQADGFTQRVKVPDIIEQAQRQVEALQGSSFNRIEWRVADPKVAEALQRLFGDPDLHLTDITVIYAP